MAKSLYFHNLLHFYTKTCSIYLVYWLFYFILKGVIASNFDLEFDDDSDFENIVDDMVTTFKTFYVVPPKKREISQSAGPR